MPFAEMFASKAHEQGSADSDKDVHSQAR